MPIKSKFSIYHERIFWSGIFATNLLTKKEVLFKVYQAMDILCPTVIGVPITINKYFFLQKHIANYIKMIMIGTCKLNPVTYGC